MKIRDISSKGENLLEQGEGLAQRRSICLNQVTSARSALRDAQMNYEYAVSQKDEQGNPTGDIAGARARLTAASAELDSAQRALAAVSAQIEQVNREKTDTIQEIEKYTSGEKKNLSIAEQLMGKKFGGHAAALAAELASRMNAGEEMRDRLLQSLGQSAQGQRFSISAFSGGISGGPDNFGNTNGLSAESSNYDFSRDLSGNPDSRGKTRMLLISQDEMKRRLASGIKDNAAIIEGYRESLNERGIPNCAWLDSLLETHRNLMNEQLRQDLEFASGKGNGEQRARVYPDIGDYNAFYNHIVQSFRTYCASGTNPNYHGICDEWGINCQRCVPTYELRRRGMEATALPSFGGFDYLSQYPYAVWENPSVMSCTSGDDQADLEHMMQIWGDGARAQVVVKWDDTVGHTFIAEQINGKTHYIDPQSGNENYIDWIDSAMPCETTFCRIDNLNPSKLISKCYREGK